MGDYTTAGLNVLMLTARAAVGFGTPFAIAGRFYHRYGQIFTLLNLL